MNAEDHDMEITLPILQSIEKESNITQRNLSKRLGLALGLTNAYLKHCINKGLVKIEQVPANRYLYYLTPKGFSEKSRLTAQYLSRSFRFYREASHSCSQIFKHCQSQGWDGVVLSGVSELTDIAVLQATRANINILGIYDPTGDWAEFLNFSVWGTLEEIPLDAVCVVTALETPRVACQQLAQRLSSERILVPEILKL